MDEKERYYGGDPRSGQSMGLEDDMNGAGYTQGMDENIQVINPMDRSPPPRVDNRN
jgi:hypothetical protein